MTKGTKALVAVVLVFSLLLSGVGYASLTDTLSVTGSASAEAPEGVFIYNVANANGINNIIYTETAIIADVAFDASGHASVLVYVRNNSANNMMYYGIDTSPAMNPGYTATITDPSKVEQGNDLDTDGTAYIAGARGDKANRLSAVTGAIIESQAAHDGLLLTLSGTPNATIDDLALSLCYDTIFDDQHWRGYTVSFMDGADPAKVTGTLPANAEYIDSNTGLLVTTVTDKNSGYTNDIDMNAISPDNTNDDRRFNSWVNASGIVVTSIPSNNANNLTLFPKWDSVREIYFVADDNTVLYSEDITGKTSVSASEEALTNLLYEHYNITNPDAAEMIPKWEEYSIPSAGTENIYVRVLWDYNGSAILTPVDTDNDGIIDHYVVNGHDETNDGTSDDVTIPAYVDGKPVTEILQNSFSGFSDLRNVTIYPTLEYIGEDAFADKENATLGIHRETIQIFFQGTMLEWAELISKSHENWDRYLGDTSYVQCTDGRYTLHVEASGSLWFVSYNTENDPMVWDPTFESVLDGTYVPGATASIPAMFALIPNNKEYL